MEYFDMYIYLIFAIKIGFVLMAITHIILKIKGDANSDLDKNIQYWKERFEFIFIILMALLLIYLFNLKRKGSVVIDGETKILLYLFGIVLLITAKWEDFFKQAKWLKIIQNIIGDRSSK
jgi:hypothetical protein